MRSEYRNIVRSEEDLRCGKCRGRALSGEILFDPDATLPNRIFCLRCLNCGGIFFPEEEQWEA
jgi:hypothetical protein